MKQYMETGKIVNTHGIKGELKVEPWSDTPDFLLELDRVFIDKVEYEVENARVHQNHVLMKLAGIDVGPYREPFERLSAAEERAFLRRAAALRAFSSAGRKKGKYHDKRKSAR